ncbi:MAG: lasso peptide biosynthesis PqqD family chaperone [Cyanothece sp. SIO1E1]|nr:lasso peptide biosynthesis PqqD family chaperone [Cyanothece sp. SIO1E1]
MALLTSDMKTLESSLIVAAPDQLSSDLAGEAVILNMKSGVYYGLNEIGARIWHLIQQPKTIKDVRNTILEEYEVEPEACDRDLLSLLQELESAGLIEVKHETTT